MNNQAAQTMPAFEFTILGLIKHWREQAEECRATADRMGVNGPAYNELLRDASQYVQSAYQLEHIAALAQTAGVADGGLEAFTDYFVKNYPGPDTIIYDPKWHAPRIFRAAQRAIQAAAQAASGGEDGATPKSQKAPLSDREYEAKYATPERLTKPAATSYCDFCGVRPGELHAFDCTALDDADEPQPPAAASVSERARELLAAEWRKEGWTAAADQLPGHQVERDDIDLLTALRAIEQALTQQRGDGEVVDRDAWAEALELPEGYTVEEFLPGGWHYAWTRADGERMVSGTTWNHPALAAIAAWQYAPATTPQPSADAVRELVAKWREDAEIADRNTEGNSYASCADELESLLSAASGEKGVG